MQPNRKANLVSLSLQWSSRNLQQLLNFRANKVWSSPHCWHACLAGLMDCCRFVFITPAWRWGLSSTSDFDSAFFFCPVKMTTGPTPRVEHRHIYSCSHGRAAGTEPTKVDAFKEGVVASACHLLHPEKLMTSFSSLCLLQCCLSYLLTDIDWIRC